MEKTNKYESRKPKGLDRSIVSDDIPVEIVPGLFLGSIHCAFNESQLVNHGITHIVNAAGLPPTFPNLFSYLTINIRDKDYANLLACTTASNLFIDSGLDETNQKRVLVHCSFGRSRSAAFVVAYLMKVRGYNFEDAYSLVKKRRPVVSMNSGFEIQLKAYEKNNFNIHKALENLIHKKNKARVNELFKKQTKLEEEGLRNCSKEIENQSTTGSGSSKKEQNKFRGFQPAVMTLLRPGWKTYQTIPPLLSMDLEFLCFQCHTSLFYSSDILACHEEEETEQLPKSDDSKSEPEGEELSLQINKIIKDHEIEEDDLESPSSHGSCGGKRRRGFGYNSTKGDLKEPDSKTSPRPSAEEPSSPMKRSSSAQSLVSIASEVSDASLNSNGSSTQMQSQIIKCPSSIVARCTEKRKKKWIKNVLQINPSTNQEKVEKLVSQDWKMLEKKLMNQKLLHISGPYGWMKNINFYESKVGNLTCPKCHSKIGTFNLNETNQHNYFQIDTLNVGTRELDSSKASTFSEVQQKSTKQVAFGRRRSSEVLPHHTIPETS